MVTAGAAGIHAAGLTGRGVPAAGHGSTGNGSKTSMGGVLYSPHPCIPDSDPSCGRPLPSVDGADACPGKLPRRTSGMSGHRIRGGGSMCWLRSMNPRIIRGFPWGIIRSSGPMNGTGEWSISVPGMTRRFWQGSSAYATLLRDAILWAASGDPLPPITMKNGMVDYSESYDLPGAPTVGEGFERVREAVGKLADGRASVREGGGRASVREDGGWASVREGGSGRSGYDRGNGGGSEDGDGEDIPFFWVHFDWTGGRVRARPIYFSRYLHYYSL